MKQQIITPGLSALFITNRGNLGEGLSQYGSNLGTTAFLSGMFMLGASSTLGGVNFITSVHNESTGSHMDEDAFVYLVSVRKRIHAVYVAAGIDYRYCVPII